MGLREKVALIIVFVAVEQIIFTCCSSEAKNPSKSNSSKVKQKQNVDSVTHAPIVITLRPQIRRAKTKNKRNPDETHETLRKSFNFPDVEYPSASTPRPPYYLQETNILQNNPIQRAAEYPTLTTVQYANNNKKNIHNLNRKNKPKQMKTTKKPGITITLSEFGTTPKPYCFRDGDFPDVEYPLSAKDTWKPNYWKPISSGPTNDNYKPGPAPKQSVGPFNRISVTARIDTVPKSQSNKKDSNNKHQGPPTSTANNNKETINNNKHVTATGELDQNDINDIKIEIHTTPITQVTKTKKINNQSNPYATPALTQSEDTKSTIPYALTPLTTLYLDTTPSYIDNNTSLKAECESTTPAPKKTSRKKKTKKKGGLQKQSKKTTLDDDDTLITSRPSSSHIYENQIDRNKPKESSLMAQCPMTSNSEEPCLTIIQPISEGNGTKADPCFYMSNDTLNTHAATINSTRFSNYINLTTISDDKIHNDYKIPIPIDNNLASISDAINTIVHDNRDSEEASCFEDNANCHKSMTCDRKPNDSLSRRADVIDLPSADEEFTTDVFPDFDENISGIFSVSTSTLSPLTLGAVDEAWVKSEVIDPYKSLSYPDELEQYYIMVP